MGGDIRSPQGSLTLPRSLSAPNSLISETVAVPQSQSKNKRSLCYKWSCCLPLDVLDATDFFHFLCYDVYATFTLLSLSSEPTRAGSYTTKGTRDSLMPASHSPKYDALPSADVPNGEAIRLSDFGKDHSSTEYLTLPYSRERYEPIGADAQDDSTRPSDFDTAGWRFGAMVAVVSTSIVLLINLSVTIWVGVRLRKAASTVHSTILTVHRGECQDVERINTWVHFAINTVSAVLLSASNYCMQCLSAPTRKETDKAHANGKWVDIGVPSIRNLKTIGKRKLFFWWCLGLSSIPLHLL